MKKTLALAVLVVLAACGGDDGSGSSTRDEATGTGNPTTSSTTPPPAADTPPEWIDDLTLPGATIETGGTFDGADLWIDTTNHVVYAEDCDVARAATNEGGPYEPAPDNTGTVIAWGHTCPGGA